MVIITLSNYTLQQRLCQSELAQISLHKATASTVAKLLHYR